MELSVTVNVNPRFVNHDDNDVDGVSDVDEDQLILTVTDKETHI